MKVACDHFGECPLAVAGKTEEVASLGDYSCPARAEGYPCHIREAGKTRAPRGAAGPPRAAVLAVAAGAAALVVGGVGWAGWSYGVQPMLVPACDAKKLQTLTALDPKAGELEKAGLACLKRGKKRAELPAMVQAVGLLRGAAEKGSGAAAVALGRLYDPLARPDVEGESKSPDVLPPTDPALAAHFYEMAARAGDLSGKDAAAALRSKYSLPVEGVQAANATGQPLAMPGHPDFFQRVLSKPGAALSAGTDGAGGQPLKAFDILYVFERRPGWLRVGHGLSHGPEGWLKEEAAQDWPVMLVMRYAPPGQRKPVLFFKDDLAVTDLISRPGASERVTQLVDGAQGGHPDPTLTAMEDRSVDWSTRPYLMPVLATRKVTADDGRTLFVAQIGSVSSGGAGGAMGVTGGVPAQPSPAPGAGAGPVAGRAGYCADGSTATLRHAVVFVIDTTISMQPYIDGVKRMAEGWGRRIQTAGIADRVRFGVIAYRNNMDAEPQRSRLEYVTRVAAPLSPSTDIAAFNAAVSGLTEAKVSTTSIDEDAAAGLQEALNQDWSPYCGARLVVFVTDSGALQSDDPRAKFKGVGLTTLAAQAREKGVTILPVHLLTPAARAAGDIPKAEAQYRQELAGTGASRRSTYSAIPNGSPAAFDAYLDRAGKLLDGVTILARGGQLKAPAAEEGSAPPAVDKLVMNELFSVQQKFLGAAAGAAAPTFATSWTSDRDLADPNLPALEVGVFLTRRQLNQLAEQTDRLTRTARAAKLETARFFDLLRMVSAATAQDPTRYGGDSTQVGALLPSFLTLLPYKSDVLSLTADGWRSMGASKQDGFIRRLEEKLAFYRALELDQSRWQSLAGSDASEQVAVVPLAELP